MALLRAYLFGEDVRQQAAFYSEALRGEIVSVQTFGDIPGTEEKDRNWVMHLVLHAAGQVFYMADAGPIERGNGLELTLEFETEQEGRQAFEALSAGGKVFMPFERMFWGTVFGRLEDKYGVRWQISTQPE
ncbi:VOC family protein [Paenibacillus radicis (ex Gao et al. 2016)]|uniref:VOC family protein n=1 Tax=Paenibacillus radicis (ex Gao et al. 2016) TaxID=1737354 RepID=A0A917M303_9BACL|nr:VOC family protein [Paenibacillus radicis (ex Gao et al. 2016)]GGG73673.1 VOC family protein [Paenibacillus radicis (ex Gao et al. 2016)]